MEENQDAKPMGDVKPKKDKGKMWSWVCWLVLLLLLALIGWLVWQHMLCKDEEETLRKENTQLRQQIDQLKAGAGSGSSSEAAAETCNDTPSASMKENIKAALDTENTAVFATYTSNPVKYILAASEFGGDISPDEAATSLEYTHSATGPWNFSLPEDTLDSYDAGFYTDYFDANTYVGKSVDNMVVAFDFNCDGKIKQIFVAASADLL